MEILWLTGLLLVFAFGLTVFFGAPFLPTLRPKVAEALDLLDLKEGQTMLELGSGDGRLLIEAAKRNIFVIGYEINLLLFLYSWLATRRYKKYITVVWGNYWTSKWPPAEGIFVFLLNPYMKKLDKKIIQYQQDFVKPVKLVSFAFEVPGRKPLRKKNGLFLYVYK